MDKHAFGQWVEDQVARYLEARGFIVLDRRVGFREGEIDIIAESPEGLLFVEVKGRRGRSFGDVVESLTWRKVRRLRKAIWRWRELTGDRRGGRILFVGVFVDEEGTVTMEEHFIE